MSEKLIIEKFGPIKRLEIDLSKVLILIGPQSSGKSTIAKLVSILRDSSFILGLMSFKEALKYYEVNSYLEKNTLIKYSSNEYNFLYEKQNDIIIPTNSKKFEDALSTIDTFKKTFPSVLKQEKKISIIDQIEIMHDFLEYNVSLIDNNTKEVAKIENKIKPFRKLVSELLSTTSDSIYIPAERLFISMIADSIISLFNNSIPLPKVLLEFGASFEKARRNLSSYEIDFLNISYKRIKNEDRIYLNKRKHIQLSNASSGLQSLIPLLLVIQDNLNDTSRESTYVIEEPELNLYPKAQYELAKIISNICSESTSEYKKNNKIVITTHSPYILTAFNNFLLANKLGNKFNQEEVKSILPQEIWVSQEDFNAYYIDGKNTGQIFNKATGLITDNHLDDASEVIMEDFDNLMNLYSNTLLNGQAN